MKSELIVDVQSDNITIALTEDDRLMEWGQESKSEATFSVGNIYYGRVKKVMPALNAVFVDVGHEKEAFLHYLDLGSQFLTLEKFTQFAVQEKNRKPLLQKTPPQKEVGKQGSIQDVCHVGQEILVQVSKEPINTKGPRLTAEISLAGRNIVLIPFGEKVMVSSKIKSEAERSRLKQLVQAIKPDKFGVIVRTVAEGKRAAELDAELRLLVRRWEDTVTRLQKAKPVSLVTEEIGRTIGVIRDVVTADFTSIYVNDQAMYEEVKSYVGLIAPEAEKIVKLYRDDKPIFDHFDITRQMKTGLGRTVGFKNGGYLIMERTEALFSIDVNSGSKKLGSDQEDNAFQCNMLAADEIYHQLRLRDIGGIIIVDFIDMDSAEHRQLLYEHMKRLMRRDRARHNVLQLSKFGLMQITRQRVRPAVEVDVQEVCPTCGGKGKIQPSILFVDMLDEQIELYKMHFGRGLKLYVHPFVYAYANQGFFFSSKRFAWYQKYGVRLLADESVHLLEYRFVGKDGKKVEIPRMTEESTAKKADKKAALYATKQIDEKPEVKLPKQQEEQPIAQTTSPQEPVIEAPADTLVQEVVVPKKKKSKKKKMAKSEEQSSTEKTQTELLPSGQLTTESLQFEQPAKEIVRNSPSAEEIDEVSVAEQPKVKPKRASRSANGKKQSVSGASKQPNSPDKSVSADEQKTGSNAVSLNALEQATPSNVQEKPKKQRATRKSTQTKQVGDEPLKEESKAVSAPKKQVGDEPLKEESKAVSAPKKTRTVKAKKATEPIPETEQVNSEEATQKKKRAPRKSVKKSTEIDENSNKQEA